MLASASFTGNWTGSGGANYAPGNSSDCRRVNFQFRQGFSTFDILRGEALCGMNTFYFPTGTLTVQNGVLMDRGFAVGMIGADYFHISYSPRAGVLNILDVRLVGTTGMSVLHTSADNSRGTTEIRGDLTFQ
jgi:hypothetical protein